MQIELEKEEVQMVLSALVNPQFVQVSNLVNKLVAQLNQEQNQEGSNNETP